MKNFLPVIKNTSIFSGISESEVEGLLDCLGAKKADYNKGEYILRLGDSVKALGLLLTGTVLIMQDDFWGNRNIISKVGSGEIFAESFACVPDAKLFVNAVAETQCSVLWLNVNGILHTCPAACSHHNKLIRNLLSDIARYNLRFNQKLTHMGQRSTRAKLLSYLSQEAQRNDSPSFDITFNRQQLADYLGVERSAMSAELSRLRDEGIIEFDKNHFLLTAQAENTTRFFKDII